VPSLPTLLLTLAAAQDSPIDLELARQAFGEAEEAALTDGGKLWNHDLLGPLLFAERATRAVVANQPDEEERLVEREGVFVGTLPAEIGIANTALDWAGVRWTMVAWPLPRDPVDRRQLLMHESFHRIQPLLAHGGGDRLCTHLDSEAGRTWLRLEYRALTAALRHPNHFESERHEAIFDALVFRARRRALFPDATGLESALERNEGLAEYTGLRLCGLPTTALAERAALRLVRDETSASFVRSFAYATGPAYGVLLDECLSPAGELPQGDGFESSWRALLAGYGDLGTVLGNARIYSWRPPDDLSGEAARRAERYGGPEIVAAERARAAERAAADARSRARFVDGPVLALPCTAGAEFSFNPNDITPLEPHGSMYGTLYLVDGWGVLDVTAGGCLFVRDVNGIPVEARVPAPADPSRRPLAGDGWTLALGEGWTLAAGARAGDWKVVRAP
jgi:hypothetical protein